MEYNSVLDANNARRTTDGDDPPFFEDLNLDQILAEVISGREEYDLRPFFCSPLREVDEVAYRQEVFRDLERPEIFRSLQSFAENMQTVRSYQLLSEKLAYPEQKRRWFVSAVLSYCEGVAGLKDELAKLPMKSRALQAFRDYLSDYAASGSFTSLADETKRLISELSALTYTLVIEGSTVIVRKYEDEADYSDAVRRTFEKFEQGAAKSYMMQFREYIEMNHVEAAIVRMVAKHYPEVFAHLNRYCEENEDYVDEKIQTFDREIQFYIAYREFTDELEKQGLKFCYPTVSTADKEIESREGFDLALATKLRKEDAPPVVCNDFSLSGKERILVVTGPNQGGKTTLARSFGQLHYFAALGCPVPGTEAKLFLFDKIFTHFEREEDISNLRGKLHDDLVRIHAILEEASSRSIIIMNEIFSSTTLTDETFLSRKVLERVNALDAIGVCVTFIDELTTLSEKTVSMASTVVPDNPAVRTFKVIRKPADGLAYALAIAEKHRVTHRHLKERIPS